MSLYNRYRPKSLDEIVGNGQLVRTLYEDLAKKDPPHAFLFHGPVGCGKTTLGRIVADNLKCFPSNFHEIDSADFRGIDTIRDIRQQSRYKPLTGGNVIVWLLDECHKLTNDAQNALLKALEDPPSHVFYVLATTDPQKLLPTVRSRCSQYQVSSLNDEEMFHLIRHVVKSEEQTLQKVVYEQIIQDSQGHPRDALQILDQVLSVPHEERLAVAKKQAELQSQTIELCRALINKAGWKKISSILAGLKDQQEPETIRRAILGYCSSVLVKGDDTLAAMIMEQMIEPFYDTGFPGLVFATYSAVHEITS